VTVPNFGVFSIDESQTTHFTPSIELAKIDAIQQLTIPKASIDFSKLEKATKVVECAELLD
jgi:hypothetical protein